MGSFRLLLCSNTRIRYINPGLCTNPFARITCHQHHRHHLIHPKGLVQRPLRYSPARLESNPTITSMTKTLSTCQHIPGSVTRSHLYASDKTSSTTSSTGNPPTSNSTPSPRTPSQLPSAPEPSHTPNGNILCMTLRGHASTSHGTVGRYQRSAARVIQSAQTSGANRHPRLHRGRAPDGRQF